MSPTLQPLNGDDMGALLENMLEAQDTVEQTDSSDSSSDQVMKDTPEPIEEQQHTQVLAAIAEPIELAPIPAEPVKEMQPLKDVEKDTSFRIEKKQSEPPKQQQEAKKQTDKANNGDDRKRLSKEEKPVREEKKPSKSNDEKMPKPVSKPSKPIVEEKSEKKQQQAKPDEKKRDDERNKAKRSDESESKKRPREDAEENEREKKRLKTTPPTKADVSPARTTDMATPSSAGKFPTHNNVWKIGEVLKRKADEMEATNAKGNECISLYIKAGLKFLEACYLRVCAATLIF